ncbi:MAG: hypothetical protein SFV81_18155 [Pirellulaceae bacterium]|nr:hypothetical protein [Pirellulaceae bacterium]
MVPKPRSSQTHSSKPLEPAPPGMRVVMMLLVGTAAAVYFGWFLSYPVLAGMLAADGEPMSRLLFLSRIMLPEMWWNEMSGGGRLPLGFGDRWLVMVWVAIWLGISFVLGRPWVRLAFLNPALQSMGQTPAGQKPAGQAPGQNEPRGWGLSRVEMISLAMLAGLALLSTVTLGVGLAGGSASLAIVYVVCVLVAVSVAMTFPLVRAPFVKPRWLSEGVTPRGVFGQLAGRMVVVLTIVLGVIYGLGSLMPPFEFDVVEYHLQSAKEFYQWGYIGFNDHNIYANMPLGLEMHGLAAMSSLGWFKPGDAWWLGGLIGKAIIGAHSLIAAFLLGGFVARKTDSRWTGWGAAGVWLAVPGNAHVATAGLIDAALGSYILAGLVVVTELFQRLATEATEAEQQRSKWLVLLLFIYAGAAAAAKYPGLIYAVVPCLVAVCLALFVTSKANRFQLAKQWIVPIACGLLLTCVPWYAKNAVLTGNPVYPLGYSVFGGKGLDAERAQQWAKAHRVPEYSSKALMDSAKQILVASDGTHPTLLFLAVCGVLGSVLGPVLGLVSVGPALGRVAIGGTASRRESVLRAWLVHWPTTWMVCCVWIFLVWWVATHRIDRFWLPAVSILAGMAGYGVAWLAMRVSHGLATVLLLFGLGYGIVVNASPVIGDNRYFVTLDGLRSDGGDDENVGRISRPIAWCNENLPHEGSRVLLVGEARVFDFRMPIIYSTCFDRSLVEGLLRGKDVEQQRENLRASGATHLLINWTEIARYRNPGNYGFSDWPSREDVEKLLESGLVRRVDWPFSSEMAEMFEVSDR